MASIVLVLDVVGASAFDPNEVRACLRDLSGIRDWDENDPDHAFFFEFDSAGDTTIVHMLNSDSRFISIEGMGVASLQVALELQRRYGKEIHAIDDGCSFDIPLSTVSSLADFEEKIRCGWGHEHLERK